MFCRPFTSGSQPIWHSLQTGFQGFSDGIKSEEDHLRERQNPGQLRGYRNKGTGVSRPVLVLPWAMWLLMWSSVRNHWPITGTIQVKNKEEIKWCHRKWQNTSSQNSCQCCKKGKSCLNPFTYEAMGCKAQWRYMSVHWVNDVTFSKQVHVRLDYTERKRHHFRLF